MKNFFLKSIVLSGLCAMPNVAFATNCIRGAECITDTTSDTIANADKAGSLLHYTNDVLITTPGQYSAAISATNGAGITFDKSATLNASVPLSTLPWVNVQTGSTVLVNGDMKLSATNIANNPIIDVHDIGSQLNVNGNFDFTLNQSSPGVPARTSFAIYVREGGKFTVSGNATIDVMNQIGNRIGLNVYGNGDAAFQALTIRANNGQALSIGNYGFVSSEGETQISSTNDIAVRLIDHVFGSLGEDAAVTSDLRNQASTMSVFNVGKKAYLDGGEYGIYYLEPSTAQSDTPALTIIKGTVKGGIAAIRGRDTSLASDTVVVEGGTILGDVLLLNGDDAYQMKSGSHIGKLDMGLGDDFVELLGGSIDGSIVMGSGHDKVRISGSFDPQKLTQIDGGGDLLGVDNTAELTIDAYSARGYSTQNALDTSKGVAFQNFNKINIVNGGTLVLSSDEIFNKITNFASNPNVMLIDETSTLTNELSSPLSQTIYGGVTNSGFMRMDGNASVGDMWTIKGDYTGNGGTVVFDTKLGDDNSPTDFLHITGNSSGNSFVNVINRGGLGALTTGDGIQLIQVDGTSQQDNFALASDYTYQGKAAVVGGAYSYFLYAGDQSGTFNGDWYLRSVYEDKPIEPTDPTNPVIPENPGNPEIPSNPVFPTLPKVPSNPVYQPGVALYETYPQALMQMNKLGTLEQRVGNRRWLAQVENGVDVEQTIEGRGFWMKIEGLTGHVNSKKSKTSADYDTYIAKTQLGLDFVAKENEKGKLIGGVYFQYGHSKTDVYSRFGKGDIKTDGYGLGGTLTWYGVNDVYVDGVAQVMWYKSDINSDTLDRREVDGNKGTGYALSIEAGRKYSLDQDWTLTPQAQLSYNSVDFDSFRDAYNARVSRQKGDALTGRLGVSLDRETAWKSSAGDMRRLKTYGIANLYYDFLDGTQVQVTGVKFRNQPDRFWGGLGAGLSHNWNDDKYSIYGEVDARSSFNDFGNSFFLNGTVGFRAKF